MNNPQDSKLWGGYFLSLCLLMALDVFIGPHSAVSLVNDILTGVSLVGLWGYISQEALGRRFAWVVLFFMQSLGTLAVSLLLFISDFPAILVAAVLGIAFPLLLALFRYAFRSPGIWRTVPAGE